MPQAPKDKAPVPRGAGMSLRVSRIELQGVVDRPQHDISRQALQDYVEQLRQQKLAEMLPATLDRETAEQKSRLLEQIEQMTRDAADESELKILEEAIQQFRAKERAPDMLSLQQLQEIAAAVAQYYRDRGLFLVRAFIPPQTVNQGIVQIHVLEGILGNVTVEQNRRYSEAQILQPFLALLDQPVSQAQIEEAMLLLNDYPGLKTFAVFRPGIHTGETDLLISVLEEETSSADLHLDNYGSEFTGEYRGRMDLHVNNPLGGNGRFTMSLSKTYKPSNGSYGALYYERRAFGPKNLFGFHISENAYDIGGDLESFGISGHTNLAQLSWRRSFLRSRLLNTYGLLQFSRKSARLGITEGENRADDLSVLNLESGFSWSNASRSHMANGWLQLSQGFEGLLGAMEATDDPAQTTASRRGGSGMYAGGKFSKAAADYQHWMRLGRHHSLHVALHGQYSEDLLASLEQMSIGGPNGVRAYAPSEFLRDKAVATSLEWIIQAPGFADWPAFGNRRWGEIIDAVLFVDYAKGWLNDPLASDQEVVSLSGIGAGLRLHYDRLSARFEFATPLGDEDASNDRDPQYFFEMNYGF